VRECRRGHERCADDVGVEDLPPRGGVGVGHLDERADARAVDERVDAAEPRGRLVDGVADGDLVGDVALDDDGALAGLLGRVVEPVLPAGEEGDLVAALAEAGSDATAEPARRPDDNRLHDRFPSTRPMQNVTRMLEDGRFSKKEDRVLPRPCVSDRRSRAR
jgi:hypothetical protein